MQRKHRKTKAVVLEREGDNVVEVQPAGDGPGLRARLRRPRQGGLWLDMTIDVDDEEPSPPPRPS